MIPSLMVMISRQRFVGYRRTITTKTTATTKSSEEYYPPCAVQVPPPPSWSVRDLRLSPSDNDGDDVGGGKISEEELATLARRCLIDIRRLSPERRDNLRIHVAGIMRCASVLLESKELFRRRGEEDAVGGIMMTACDGREKRNQLSDEEVYDAPRGLAKMPIRGGGRRSTKGVGDDIDEDEDDLEQWTLYDSKESKAIMQNDSVRSKMVKTADGETLFSVITKRS